MLTPQVRKGKTNLGCCHIPGTGIIIPKINLTIAIFLLLGAVVLTLL